MNLVDARARAAQDALLTITREQPDKTIAEVRRLTMPAHHSVHGSDVNEKRLGAVLALAHDRDLHDFASFLLLEQLGPIGRLMSRIGRPGLRRSIGLEWPWRRRHIVELSCILTVLTHDRNFRC